MSGRGMRRFTFEQVNLDGWSRAERYVVWVGSCCWGSLMRSCCVSFFLPSLSPHSSLPFLLFFFPLSSNLLFFFPPDQDTAEFLCSVLPDLWLAKYNVSVAKVTVALQQANLKTPRPAFEERVAQALTTLGPPPPPPPR